MTDIQPRGDLGPPLLDADEKTTLVTFLDYLRGAIVAKAAGVGDQQARFAGVASGTSLLGLVRHLTAVELNWFVWAYGGADVPRWDMGIVLNADDTSDRLLDLYGAAVERANDVVARCHDLNRPGARSLRPTAPPSMRWILVHMIEETARHAGHADIIREQIDGSIGR